MRLTLEALTTIDAIVTTGSFSGAATKLHKVPSTISYTVNKLEAQMGLRFFERSGPRIELTAIGEALVREGRCLLIMATDLERRLYQMAQGIEFSLAIALDELLPLGAFSQAIGAFNALAYKTRLSFHHEVLTGTWEALMQRRADLIIAAGEGPSGGGYETHKVGHLAFIFCVAPSHPLANLGRPLQKNDLLQHTAIVIGDSARAFSKRTTGVYFGQPQLSVATLADKITLQKAGLGHGFLPKACITAALTRGELVECSVMEPMNDEVFYLAWRTGETGLALGWWRERLSHEWLHQVMGDLY